MEDITLVEQARIFRDVATGAGILLGGLWAFWKWSLSEYFRKKNEIPAIDGEMTWQLTPLSDQLDCITVNCVWRNVGVVVLPVNTQETRFTAYELKTGVNYGAIEINMEYILFMLIISRGPNGLLPF